MRCTLLFGQHHWHSGDKNPNVDPYGSYNFKYFFFNLIYQRKIVSRNFSITHLLLRNITDNFDFFPLSEQLRDYATSLWCWLFLCISMSYFILCHRSYFHFLIQTYQVSFNTEIKHFVLNVESCSWNFCWFMMMIANWNLVFHGQWLNCMILWPICYWQLNVNVLNQLISLVSGKCKWHQYLNYA